MKKLFASTLFLLLLHFVTEAHATSTCSCAKVPPPDKPGTCYYFVNRRTRRCRARDCHAGFVCTPGKSTGMICIKQKITKKITLVAPGRCEERPGSGTQLVLYNFVRSSRTSPSPAPESQKPTNERGEYVVIGGNKIISHHTRLFDAMKELKQHTRDSRCIFEVKNKQVVSDPHRIAGFEQSTYNGFNNQWDSWYDIRRMYRIAALWYADQHKRKPMRRGKFIVVANEAVVQLFTTLKPAMKELRNHHSKVSRCIFEVKGHRVQRNPGMIAGYAQTMGNGFDKYWNDGEDIERMYRIARVWYARMKLPGKYIAVANNEARIFNRLYKAQNVLLHTDMGARCIFQARRGRVVPNPRRIASINQNTKNYFNVRWGNVSKLRRIAFLEYARRFIKLKNYSGPFIVVSNTKAKTYGNLQSAMEALRYPTEFSRCIFAVEDNAVVSDPTIIKGYAQKPEMGFDSYWSNPDDIRRMYRLAKQWWEGTKKPKVNNKKGTFVVVAKNVVIGIYNRLFDAQRALKIYQGENRAVFEVKNGNVIRGATTIAGYPQTKQYGFDKKWKNESDLNRLYRVAKRWSKTFVVVHGSKLRGPFGDTKSAGKKMRALAKKSKKPLSVFLVSFGHVSYVKVRGERWKNGERKAMQRTLKTKFEEWTAKRVNALRRK